ncbi:proteasome subunit beta [Candidatus Woesearchaeota archaeon]|nr:proteasome subunit beta [Candidatus Woesearchaeota archaeon]
MENDVMKTGTTTVGIIAKDCIVLAADKRSTAGNFIADRKVDKIIQVNDFMALTTAGLVSDIQLVVKIIKAELALKEVRTAKQSKVKEAANLAAGLVYSNIRKLSMIPGVIHFLFAGYDNSGIHLYDIYPDGAITEIEEFVSSGSGSPMAYGVFESLYKKNLTQDQAVELALKAINSAIRRDSASGEGIDVVIVDGKGVRKILSKELKFAE